MGKTLGLGLCWIAFCCQELAAEGSLYQVTRGEKKDWVVWNYSLTADRLIEFQSDNRLEQAQHSMCCSADFQTLRWTFNDPQNDTQYSVERIQNRLCFFGKIRGRTIDQSSDIDNIPWYQVQGFSFPHLLAPSREEWEFYSIRPHDAKVVRLTAKRQGTEKITVNQEMVSAIRVDIRLAGLLAGIGKVTFWFREQDYQFVRYEGSTDLTGSIPVIYQLQESLPALRDQPFPRKH